MPYPNHGKVGNIIVSKTSYHHQLYPDIPLYITQYNLLYSPKITCEQIQQNDINRSFFIYCIYSLYTSLDPNNLPRHLKLILKIIEMNLSTYQIRDRS